MRKKYLAIGLIVLSTFFSFSLVENAKAGSEDNVFGWAWSDTIGWISFNNTTGGGLIDYGVNIGSDGVFSGYAWSENIGWIDFAPSGPYPEVPDYSVQSEFDFGNLSGWARAVTYDELGGWDGWIKMRGTWLDGVSAGKGSSGLFSGWAWGDTVVGWIDFTGVETTFNFNRLPSATNLLISTGNYCNASAPPIFLNWDFSDLDVGDSQSAYQVQVDDNSDFSSPEKDSGKVSSASHTYAPTGLAYNTTYYWRVKVWDTYDGSSDWSVGPSSFTTALHAYPLVNFSNLPEKPAPTEITSFTDQSIVYGGATKESWLWIFEDGDPATFNTQNGTTTFIDTGDPVQNKSVTLEVVDSDGFSCQIQDLVGLKLPPPCWDCY